MAIREVLLSNTFEQQRQLINLIGTDIGDCQNLVTPSKVVTTSVNQVVAGFVTLSGQTIQLEDGTLAAPSLSFDSTTNLGLYKVDANTLGVSKSLYVASGLTVEGDITFRAGNGSAGTIIFGDLNTDNIVFNADLNSHAIPNFDNTYDLGTSSQEWRDLYIDGTAYIDTLQVDENLTVTGDVAVNGGDITTTASGVTVFNSSATTASIFGDATSITLGATTGTLTLRNPVVVGTSTTQTLYNTVATTVNAFGAAYNVTMGVTAPSGVPNTNFRIRSDDTVLDGDLNVNGGEILSSQNSFNLLINNSDIRIGSAIGTGSTVINNSLKIKGTTLDLTDQTFTVSLRDNINPALIFREGTNDYLSFQTSDTLEKVIFHKDASFTQNAIFSDSRFLYFGDGNDLAIYHDGSDSYIRDQGTGNLYIQGTNNVSIRKDDGSEVMAVFNADGASELYFDNSKKLETTATGITVTGDISVSNINGAGATFTGNVTASGVTVNGNLTVNGTTTTINSTVLSIDDVNIVLADGASTSAAVDGAGITLGTTGITFTYSNTGTRWSSTENLNIATGKTYQIAGTTVLSATQVLGRGFTNAAGEIVTTDGTQTLSAKTLTSPAINGGAFGSASSTTDADATVDASVTTLYAYVQSASTTARTINISNLAPGRIIELYLRNTNAGAKTINITASNTTTGFTAVNLSKGDAGGTSQTSVTLAATSGTAVVLIFNANGVIGGSIS